MNTYLCRRHQPYQNPRCLGYTELSERQGYYIDAASEQEAIAIMGQMHPNDSAGFTVQLWIDDFSEPEPDNTKRYLYRLYRKSEFMFLGGKPLDELRKTS